MNGKSTSLMLLNMILGAMLVSTGEAVADPLYTVTNLGDSYTLNADDTGYVSAVVASDGSQYTFDKSPVKNIYEFNSSPYSAHGVYTVLTLQNGSYKVGYGSEQASGVGYSIYYPISGGWSHGWDTPYGSPVNDLNSHGQYVGSSTDYLSVNPSATFAAFSTETGTVHAGPASRGDNLNYYIAQGLGIDLTSAVKIDDLGQIIAGGTLNGKAHPFLLTPNGQPTPAPEPSTLAILGFTVVGIGIRSCHRHLRRWRDASPV